MEYFYEKGKKYNYVANDVPYFRKSATINGKRRYFYGDGEKDCLHKIEEAKKQESAGLDFDKRSAKVGPTIKYWLYNVKRVDKKIKASSFARYEMSYRNHIEPYDICKINLSALNSAIMQAYVTGMYEKENKPGPTIAATVKVWKMFCSWAVDEGYLIKDPVKNLSLPGKHDNKRVIEVFTEEERKALLAYMDKSRYQYDTVIKLGFATGMRMGELLGLRWDKIKDDSIEVANSTAMVTHVDAEGNRTRSRENWDPKTINGYRIIPMLESTSIMLQEHRKKQEEYFTSRGMEVPEFIFTTSSGVQVDPANMRVSYQRLLERAGVPYRKFHTIRHTFATEAIRRGVDVKDLQMLMGHSDISMTYIYVQSDQKSKRNAIERMGEII